MARKLLKLEVEVVNPGGSTSNISIFGALINVPNNVLFAVDEQPKATTAKSTTAAGKEWPPVSGQMVRHLYNPELTNAIGVVYQIIADHVDADYTADSGRQTVSVPAPYAVLFYANLADMQTNGKHIRSWCCALDSLAPYEA